jgi:hypothetical protein
VPEPLAMWGSMQRPVSGPGARARAREGNIQLADIACTLHSIGGICSKPLRRRWRRRERLEARASRGREGRCGTAR